MQETVPPVSAAFEAGNPSIIVVVTGLLVEYMLWLRRWNEVVVLMAHRREIRCVEVGIARQLSYGDEREKKGEIIRMLDPIVKLNNKSGRSRLNHQKHSYIIDYVSHKAQKL